MEKRDYLMDQIRLIGKLISNILGELSDNPNALESTQIQFKEHLNLDIENLVAESRIDSEKYFDQSNFTLEQIYNIAQYLFKVAMNNTAAKKKIYLQKSLQLIEYINIKSASVSFESMAFEQKIKSLLKA